MKSPAVSVVIPVFNGERFLEDALASIFVQTFADFEVVAVDDGSTDGSLAILERLAQRDPRLRVISRQNTGIVGALNDGIAAARGDFIARMDADDLALPERFALQVEYLRAHPECVLLGTHVLRVDPEGLPIGPEEQPLDHEAILGRLLDGAAGTLTHPSIMMRRDALAVVGGYRQEFQWVEDYDVFFRLAERGRLANLPETLLHYRLHYESVNMKKRALQTELARQCLSAACARLGIPNREPDAKTLAWLAKPLDRVTTRGGWARRALAMGFYPTARKHAWANLLAEPWRPAWWKLLILGILRRPTIPFRSVIRKFFRRPLRQPIRS